MKIVKLEINLLLKVFNVEHFTQEGHLRYIEYSIV